MREEEEKPSCFEPVLTVLRKLGIAEEEDPGCTYHYICWIHCTYGLFGVGYFKEKMRSNFLFNSPELYFSLIDLVLMLISFYMALWVVNFSYSTGPFPEADRSNWIVGSLVPGVASALLFTYVVRTSFLVKVNWFQTNLMYWNVFISIGGGFSWRYDYRRYDRRGKILTSYQMMYWFTACF